MYLSPFPTFAATDADGESTPAPGPLTAFVDSDEFAGASGSLYDETDIDSGVDKVTCPRADNAANACAKIIDAAQYIGVTYDMSSYS